MNITTPPTPPTFNSGTVLAVEYGGVVMTPNCLYIIKSYSVWCNYSAGPEVETNIVRTLGGEGSQNLFENITTRAR